MELADSEEEGGDEIGLMAAAMFQWSFSDVEVRPV